MGRALRVWHRCNVVHGGGGLASQMPEGTVADILWHSTPSPQVWRRPAMPCDTRWASPLVVVGGRPQGQSTVDCYASDCQPSRSRRAVRGASPSTKATPWAPAVDPLQSFSKTISKPESGFSAGRVAVEDGVISSACQTRLVVEIEPCAQPKQRLLKGSTVRRTNCSDVPNRSLRSDVSRSLGGHSACIAGNTRSLTSAVLLVRHRCAVPRVDTCSLRRLRTQIQV